MWWIIVAIFWVVIGVFVYGWEFAWWQNRFNLLAEEHYRSDLLMSLCDIFLGPISILVLLITLRCEKKKWYGWRLW